MSIAKEKIECAVLGAGVVGLAVARALAPRFTSLLVLEKENRIGTGISSRNSEVIHAGIYYPTKSLKSKLCLRGANALYNFCSDMGIPHKRCGKLIVATSDNENIKLRKIASQAKLNGVTDIEWLNSEDVRYLEPNINATNALYSPSTGIVDAHSLMLALLADAEDKGVTLCLKSPVLHGKIEKNGKVVICTQDIALECDFVINCTGLSASKVSGSIENLQAPPELIFAKGNYFSLEQNSIQPFSRLVYPLPDEGGLGIHATIDTNNKVRFGPDVEWLNMSKKDSICEIQYDVSEDRAGSFYESIRRYWPGVMEHVLIPDYSGVRPKVRGKGSLYEDFLIKRDSERWISCYGIESPGLTSALAIGEYISDLIQSVSSN